MLVSILVLATMIVCLPWWLKVHYQWLAKRQSWVLTYLVLHSLIAFPMDLLSYLTGVGTPSAPLSYYPLVILNALIGPILVTLTTIVSVIGFWLDGGVDYCRVTEGMMSVTRRVVGEKFELYAFLVGIAPAVVSILEKAWGVMRPLMAAILEHIDWSAVDFQKIFSFDYLSLRVPGLAGYLPSIVILLSLFYCAWKGWQCC